MVCITFHNLCQHILFLPAKSVHHLWYFVWPWWRHFMETFSALLSLCAAKSPVNSPHKGQLRGALMFSMICAWINGWVNNREAVDLRRHCAHYDVTVMYNSCIRFGAHKPHRIHVPFVIHCLSHLPWTKWPPIWQTAFTNQFSWTKMIEFLFKLVPRSPIIDNKPALV